MRAATRFAAIHSEINRAIGGEGWAGVAVGLDVPFALAFGQDGLDEIGIAKINDAGVVDDWRAEQAVGDANCPALLAFRADGEEDGRAMAFDVDHAICANGGKPKRTARQLNEPENVAVEIEAVEPLLMGEIDRVVTGDHGRRAPFARAVAVRTRIGAEEDVIARAGGVEGHLFPGEVGADARGEGEDVGEVVGDVEGAASSEGWRSEKFVLGSGGLPDQITGSV